MALSVPQPLASLSACLCVCIPVGGGGVCPWLWALHLVCLYLCSCGSCIPHECESLCPFLCPSVPVDVLAGTPPRCGLPCAGLCARSACAGPAASLEQTHCPLALRRIPSPLPLAAHNPKQQERQDPTSSDPFPLLPVLSAFPWRGAQCPRGPPGQGKEETQLDGGPQI